MSYVFQKMLIEIRSVLGQETFRIFISLYLVPIFISNIVVFSLKISI